MERRYKLKTDITPTAPFTHVCARCHGWLFRTDNYCANCGEHVSDEVVIGVVKGTVSDTSNDDWNKPMEEPV